MMQDIQPTIIENAPRIIVIGDVHGDIKRFMQCLYHANVFSKDLQWIANPPNTIVVQLGDQVDSMTRGPTSGDWEELPDVDVLTLTDKLDEIARIGGGRVLSIIGNHEFMNVMSEFSYVSEKSKAMYDMSLRRANFRIKDGLFTKILAKRNLVLKIGPYLFCHGGILPHHLDAAHDNLFLINDAFRRFLTDRFMSMEARNVVAKCIDENGIIWTRYYVENDANVGAVMDEVLRRTHCIALFIGHCTVPQTTMVQHKVVLADAALSRSFGSKKFQYVELANNSMTAYDLE